MLSSEFFTNYEIKESYAVNNDRIRTVPSVANMITNEWRLCLVNRTSQG